ncbi:MAG: ABC transporter ATP-binding protein [Candidatus Ornithospirochaeta sp.]|nr:ABC transporter ATP-binding protein [Sphaerochaetaceae bacterium]MDY5523315.1 ABC transporter ATP-binding protein [Candidatus Ornithospirochaeta sp.]
MANFRNKGIFSRFLSYYGPYKGWFFLDMAMATLSSVLSIISPLLVRKVLALIGVEGALSTIVILLSAVLAFYALGSLFSYIRIKWGHYLGVWIENDMRRDLFNHLQKLSFSYFDRHKTGDIMSRISNDLFNIAEVAHHGPEDVVISLLTIIGAYLLMFIINAPMATVSIIPLPIMAIYGIVFNRKLKKRNRAIRKSISEINVTAENSIQGIREVKAFSQEGFQEKKFSSSNEKLKNSREKMYSSMAQYHAGMEFMRQLYYFITIAGGIILIMKGTMDTADLTTFILYVSVVLPPIDRLINFTEQFTQGIASFERFIEIMDTSPDITDAANAKPLEVKNGDIKYSDVSFSYTEGEKEIVIDGLDLHIPGGKRVALVGESGAGKSTTVSLLARFYERSGGMITIDGQDINTVTQDSLHKSIGFVQQNIFLFDSSIRENLRYGKSDATDEELWHALEWANLADFVRSLPEGLDTQVGEHGTRLSGGQKQRLSIARVFLKNPPILVFDEATSSLDTESETLIQSAFNRLSKGRTSIIIAHRLSTVIDCDIIFVLDKGRVVEKGTHDELIAQKGLYYKLYSLK